MLPDNTCGPERITGDALLLTIGGVNYWSDCTSVIFTRDDGKDTHRADGTPLDVNVTWAVEVQAVQSFDPASLYRLLWSHGGQERVPFAYSPWGDGDPTDERPHFTGLLRWLPHPPTLGGEAGESSTYVYSVTIPLVCKPVMVTEPDLLSPTP